MIWRRLSERTGKRKPSVQHESIPPYLLGELVRWLITQFEMSPYNMGMMVATLYARLLA